MNGTQSAASAAAATDVADEHQKAPIRLMTQFLKAVVDENMRDALDMANMILKYEPDNRMVLEYQEVLSKCVSSESEPASDASEDETTSSDSDGEETSSCSSEEGSSDSDSDIEGLDRAGNGCDAADAKHTSGSRGALAKPCPVSDVMAAACVLELTSCRSLQTAAAGSAFGC